MKPSEVLRSEAAEPVPAPKGEPAEALLKEKLLLSSKFEPNFKFLAFMGATLATLDRPLTAPADIGGSVTASACKSAASSVFFWSTCAKAARRWGVEGGSESAAGLKGRGQISEAAILQPLQVDRSCCQIQSENPDSNMDSTVLLTCTLGNVDASLRLINGGKKKTDKTQTTNDTTLLLLVIVIRRRKDSSKDVTRVIYNLGDYFMTLAIR